MRLVFAGTPEFAKVSLAAVHAAGHEVVAVLTQPDRPAGRGLSLQASAVKCWAQEHHLEVLQPPGLRLQGPHALEAQRVQQRLLELAPEVMVVAAYGLLLPPWVLSLPPRGCVNVHASLLPRWRGAAPIVRCIEAGDPLTGITIMQMDEGLDTGPMILHESLSVDAQETAASLHDRLAALGGQLIVRALAALGASAAERQPQPSEGITVARKIDKSESRINWDQDAQVIERRVRAFDPFPGSVFEWNGQQLKLWRARVVPEVRGEPGQVVPLGPHRWAIACGQGGAIEPVTVQRSGGRRIPFSQVIR